MKHRNGIKDGSQNGDLGIFRGPLQDSLSIHSGNVLEALNHCDPHLGL